MATCCARRLHAGQAVSRCARRRAAATSGAMGEEGPSERIAKRLARAGVASRRVAETMIAAGRVAVNGRVIDSPALERRRGRPGHARRAAGGRARADAALALPQAAGPRRPRERDERGRETVFAHLPEGMPRVVRVGRLDLNSEGLLLLTNDGALERRLELPSTGWQREYRVRVHGRARRGDARAAPSRHHRRRRAVPADAGRDRPAAGVERLADAWLSARGESRDSAGAAGGRAGGQPADPGRLRAVPARRPRARARSRRCGRRCCASNSGSSGRSRRERPGAALTVVSHAKIHFLRR